MKQKEEKRVKYLLAPHDYVKGFYLLNFSIIIEREKLLNVSTIIKETKMKPTNIIVTTPKGPDIRNEPGTRGPQPGSTPRIGATPPPKK